MKVIRKYFGVLVLTLFCVVGCDRHEKDFDDINQRINHLRAQVKQAKQKAVPENNLSGLQDKKHSLLQPAGSKKISSPFRGVNSQRQHVTSNPLEKYAIGKLQFVGVIAYHGDPKAAFVTPAGKVYRVGKGDLIGLHHGRIISVHDGGVTVEEKVSNEFGEVVRRVINLKLKRQH